MALATYSDLQAAIANYLARPGDTLVATPADLSFGPIQQRSIPSNDRGFRTDTATGSKTAVYC